MALTLMLVDDHALFRDGLRAMLESQPDLKVVAEAGNAQEAYAALERCEPDLALVDVAMPGIDGIALARQIRTRSPKSKVLMLSMLIDNARVSEALAAGAVGYATKDEGADQVFHAIRTVAAGKTWISPRIGEARVPASAAMAALATLTRREREIFDLVASGETTLSMAKNLGISPRTVETHRSRILAKLDLHSASDLVRLAARCGLLVD